jgi:hypothetical protein
MSIIVKTNPMNPTVLAAIIGVVGVALGALLKEFLPVIIAKLKPKDQVHNLVDDWMSSWGPLPNGPAKYSEDLRIYEQDGYEIKGEATRSEESGKKWEVRGRYEGQFLQMYYFPSADSKDKDFLDYGCYFLKRKSDGSFEGYSTGFGKSKGDSAEVIKTDFHSLKRKK